MKIIIKLLLFFLVIAVFSACSGKKEDEILISACL